jgi:hypothetical protein
MFTESTAKITTSKTTVSNVVLGELARCGNQFIDEMQKAYNPDDGEQYVKPTK